jgi:hypothetical protein
MTESWLETVGVHRLIVIGVDRFGGDRMFSIFSREMEKPTIPLEG